MPWTDRALAGRLDRMSRAAHRFHRFAHHPLCVPYARETFRIGRRVRICKGCSLAAAGLASGLALGLALLPSLSAAMAVLGSGSVLGGASLLFRLPKSLSRLAPGLSAGLAAGSGGWASLAGIVAALGFVLLYRLRRPAAPTLCPTCPEFGTRPCSGFAPIVRRERAFVRFTARFLSARSRRSRSPLASV